MSPAQSFSVDERAILDQVNQKVAASESIERIIDFLFDSTEKIFPCDRIGLSLIEDEGRRVVAHYTRASYEPVLLSKGYAEDLQGSSLAEVVRRGVPRVISDLESYLKEHPHSPSTGLLVKEGVRSSMTCPLAVEGRNVGLLFRSSRRKDAYDDHQVMLHLAVAERLAQAVEKAWRIEQLSEANRSYFEMLGFVSHELKSPLASIIMEGEILSKNYMGDLTPEQKEHVGKMIGKAENLLGLIREYLDLSSLEGGSLRIDSKPGIDLRSQVVEPCIEVLKPQIKEKKSRMEIAIAGDAPRVSCDPDALGIVLTNLIGNGVKYGNDGGLVRISAGFAPDSFSMSVWNEGPGFSEDGKKMLFRRFSRISDPELLKRKGTGLGLYTTWRIVNLHGGRIWARSEQGKWAEFSFTIPQTKRGD
ncbi:MAG: GAF domain-containing sensor histidine kinase [bacterium]